MKKYTFAAYDWRGNLVELRIIAENQQDAGKIARDIFETSLQYINIDEGIFPNNEEDYK